MGNDQKANKKRLIVSSDKPFCYIILKLTIYKGVTSHGLANLQVPPPKFVYCQHSVHFFLFYLRLQR